MSLLHPSVNDSSEAISEVLETSGAVILDDAGSSEALGELRRLSASFHAGGPDRTGAGGAPALLPRLAPAGGNPVPLLSALDRARSGPGAPRSDGVFERWHVLGFFSPPLGPGEGPELVSPEVLIGEPVSPAEPARTAAEVIDSSK